MFKTNETLRRWCFFDLQNGWMAVSDVDGPELALRMLHDGYPEDPINPVFAAFDFELPASAVAIDESVVDLGNGFYRLREVRNLADCYFDDFAGFDLSDPEDRAILADKLEDLGRERLAARVRNFGEALQQARERGREDTFQAIEEHPDLLEANSPGDWVADDLPRWCVNPWADFLPGWENARERTPFEDALSNAYRQGAKQAAEEALTQNDDLIEVPQE